MALRASHDDPSTMLRVALSNVEGRYDETTTRRFFVWIFKKQSVVSSWGRRRLT